MVQEVPKIEQIVHAVKSPPRWIVLGKTHSVFTLLSQKNWFLCLAKPFFDQNRSSCKKREKDSVICAFHIPVPFLEGLIISLQFIKNG